MSISDAIKKVSEGDRVIAYQQICEGTFILHTANNGTVLVLDGEAVTCKDGGEA